MTVLLGAAAWLTGSGCATSYKTEKAADITVSAAMTAWGNYVAQYHPPVSQELQVKAAFEKYQAAEILAVDATHSLFDLTSTNSATAGSTNAVSSATAQAKVTQAVAAEAQALADLIALIQGFGIKITTGTAATPFAPVPTPSPN